jgi:general secretion pathway protein M
LDRDDTLNDSWTALKEAARQAWSKRTERERWALSLAGAVLALALLWGVGIAPALRTLHEAPRTLARLDVELEHMHGLADEAARLRQAPSIAPAQAEEALRAATQRLGGDTNLAVQGGRATVTLGRVPGWALSAWLSEIRAGAHARPQSAQLTLVDGTDYTGTIVLDLGQGDQE